MCVSKVHSIPAKFNTGEDSCVRGGISLCICVINAETGWERQAFRGTILSHDTTFTSMYSTDTHLSSLWDPEGIQRFFVLLCLHLILPVSPQRVSLFLAVTPHPPQTISFLVVHHSSLPFCLLLIPHSSLSVPGSLRTRAPVCVCARACVGEKGLWPS